MELVDIEVTGKKSLTLPWTEINIMPVGDVQLGSQGVDVDRLRKQIAWANKQTADGGPPVYFVGMGDYIDIMSPSNRLAWQSTRLYDSVREAMEDKAAEYEREFVRLVAGTEGRWLGLLQGHHFFAHEDGTTSDTRIAQALHAPFLGTCAFVSLTFKAQASGMVTDKKLRCVLWAHHGAGGGITPQSPLNRLVNIMHYFEADIYLIGHQTKRPVVPVPRIYMSDRAPFRLIAKKKILAGTGGFTKGYNEYNKNLAGRPEGGYVEKAMMGPVSLGSILLKIRPVFGSGSGKTISRLDINCEV